MQAYIGAFEAKTHFSALLERVEHGEEIIISRRGRPIARMTPIEEKQDSAKAMEAVKALRTLRSKIKVSSWEEWKQYRDEGRK